MSGGKPASCRTPRISAEAGKIGARFKVFFLSFFGSTLGANIKKKTFLFPELVLSLQPAFLFNRLFSFGSGKFCWEFVKPPHA